MFTLTTGYTAVISVTLRKNGVVFAIPGGATVRAAIVASDHTKILVQPVDVLEASSGSDWPNSLIIVKFTEAATALIKKPGQVKMEIQVNDGGKLPWFISGEVIKGNI